MQLEQFKQQFIALVNWGWSGDYATELTAKANDNKTLAKIYSHVKLRVAGSNPVYRSTDIN